MPKSRGKAAEPEPQTDYTYPSYISNRGMYIGMPYLTADGAWHEGGKGIMSARGTENALVAPDGKHWTAHENAIYPQLLAAQLFAMEFKQPSPSVLPPQWRGMGFVDLNWGGTPA